jgi:alkylated DNA nucleotide flippase Atl1
MVEWTDERVRRLLLVVIHVHKIKVDTDEVAAVFGEGATASAVAHKLTRLRREVKISGEESVAAGRVASTCTKRKSQKVQDGGITKKKATTARKIDIEPEEPYGYYEE